MARPPADLGPEIPDCPGQFHGTAYAHRCGCTCPSARQARSERDKAWRQRGGPAATREIDHIAVKFAVDGKIHPRKLTTPERVAVITHLAARGWTDREIGQHLRWSDTSNRCREAVCRFRLRHHIPAGQPALQATG